MHVLYPAHDAWRLQHDDFSSNWSVPGTVEHNALSDPIAPVPLCCIQTVWYYPNEVYVDKELLAKTRYTKVDGDYGKASQIVLFSGSKALVRRSDGVLVTIATSPYPIMLYDMVKRAQWDKATRLCRFIKVGAFPRGGGVRGR